MVIKDKEDSTLVKKRVPVCPFFSFFFLLVFISFLDFRWLLLSHKLHLLQGVGFGGTLLYKIRLLTEVEKKPINHMLRKKVSFLKLTDMAKQNPMSLILGFDETITQD